MASTKAIRSALKVLSLNFAGEVSTAKTQLWAAALEDVSDEQLEAAIPEVIKTHRGEFIPPVAVVRDAAGANAALAVDADRILRDIGRAGSHNATAGFSGPSAVKVTEEFGTAVGEAYALAGGGSALFAENETTREIARRDFRRALAQESRITRTPEAYRLNPPKTAPALAAPERKALKAGAPDA
jgi:hypothetical protein